MTCDRSVVSSTNKTDRHDITEILLKVTLSTIKKQKQTNIPNYLQNPIYVYVLT